MKNRYDAIINNGGQHVIDDPIAWLKRMIEKQNQGIEKEANTQKKNSLRSGVSHLSVE